MNVAENQPGGQQTAPQENAPAPGTPEYNQKMVELYESQGKTDQNQQSFTAPVERPEYIPEKFWDAEKGQPKLEEMAKSYSELEKKFSQGGEVNAKGDPAGSTQDQPKAGSEEELFANGEKLGLDWNNLEQRVLSGGALSDEEYAKLEQLGVPKFVADAHINMLKTYQEVAQERTFTYAGNGDPQKGKVVVDRIMQWAESNLTPQEIDFYNAQLQSTAWKAAVDTLRTRMGDPTAREPNMIAGQQAGGGSTAFASQVEMVNAINDPRYRTDPAYRAQVRQRIAISNF